MFSLVTSLPPLLRSEHHSGLLYVNNFLAFLYSLDTLYVSLNNILNSLKYTLFRYNLYKLNCSQCELLVLPNAGTQDAITSVKQHRTLKAPHRPAALALGRRRRCSQLSSGHGKDRAQCICSSVVHIWGAPTWGLLQRKLLGTSEPKCGQARLRQADTQEWSC